MDTTMKFLNEVARFLLFMAVGAVLAWFVIYELAEVPLVYRSWSTRECVGVDPAEAGDCDNLPERYQTIWVK